MISALDSKILDRNCEALGISIDTLMGHAGEALYNVLIKEFEKKKIIIVCGTGNNGGDGLACAKHFGKKATVAMLLPPDMIKKEPARRRFEALDRKAVMFSDVYLDQYDVVVDCVLGVGARAPLDAVHKDYIKQLKDFKGKIVSADVPTGLGMKTAVVPDITVTFHDVKEGMTKENSGRIIVADIGIPEEAAHVMGPGDMLLYPLPKDDSHKGENGRLLVIGGGPYIGAPAMAAMASLRAGIDIVHIATPRRSFIPIASMTPNFIMHELSEDALCENDVKKLLDISRHMDAVLIGPGLGTAEGTMAAVREFVLRCGKPLVIDADGITAVSTMSVMPSNTIITPHRKEFEKFSGFVANSCDLMEVSKKRNVTMLLKGVSDVIVHNDVKRTNRSGNAAMTVGGTGDVLSGIVAGLLSKHMHTFGAACLGAYICGRAGDRAFDEFSYGLTATDVIEMIPKVLKDHLKG
ncbi:MAG: NAD(P)H-hydrate dehydratase [Methanomassiliicoccaceae archaeon]|jgi:NAD(P)H-hydrate epimerase|nr:NAD(P)H-hydrate dehydratase [Methanomassiliicoccaceae archaeon]